MYLAFIISMEREQFQIFFFEVHTILPDIQITTYRNLKNIPLPARSESFQLRNDVSS